MKKQFKMVSANNQEAFDKEVTELLNQGYELQDSKMVPVMMGNQLVHSYYANMIKSDEDTDKWETYANLVRKNTKCIQSAEHKNTTYDIVYIAWFDRTIAFVSELTEDDDEAPERQNVHLLDWCFGDEVEHTDYFSIEMLDELYSKQVFENEFKSKAEAAAKVLNQLKANIISGDVDDILKSCKDMIEYHIEDIPEFFAAIV